MKGLIKNNFYSVSSALKVTIALCIFINIALAIVAIFNNVSITILPMLMLGEVGAFVGLTATGLQKDNAAKWSRFEITLPVKRYNIIGAKYVSFLIFSFIGILLATMTVLIFSAVSAQSINLERVGFGYSFGITFALLVPAILYPLVLKFGADKSELLLLLSILIVVCLFLGSSAVFTIYFNNLNNIDIIFRISCVAASVVIFIISYYISVAIHKRKEL